MKLGFLGLALALVGGCATAESVGVRLGRAQLEAAEARTGAEDGSAGGDRAAAVANAAAAVRTLRDAQAWIDAYAATHGGNTSTQFDPALRRITADVAAARGAALKTGATPESIEAEAVRRQPTVQAGAGAGGGGGGGGGGGM